MVHFIQRLTVNHTRHFWRAPDRTETILLTPSMMVSGSWRRSVEHWRSNSTLSPSAPKQQQRIYTLLQSNQYHKQMQYFRNPHEIKCNGLEAVVLINKNENVDLLWFHDIVCLTSSLWKTCIVESSCWMNWG